LKRKLFIFLAAFFSLLSSVLVSFALDPAAYDFGMQAGEDFALQLTLNQCADNPPPVTPDKCRTWTPQNLTGYSYKSQFRSAPYPAGQVFTTYSSVVVNAATGRLDIRLSRQQTATHDGKQGYWDLQQTAPDGKVSYLLTGKTRVHPTVTR
jgi:hypothetical protein